MDYDTYVHDYMLFLGQWDVKYNKIETETRERISGKYTRLQRWFCSANKKNYVES